MVFRLGLWNKVRFNRIGLTVLPVLIALVFLQPLTSNASTTAISQATTAITNLGVNATSAQIGAIMNQYGLSGSESAVRQVLTTGNYSAAIQGVIVSSSGLSGTSISAITSQVTNMTVSQLGQYLGGLSVGGVSASDISTIANMRNLSTAQYAEMLTSAAGIAGVPTSTITSLFNGAGFNASTATAALESLKAAGVNLTNDQLASIARQYNFGADDLRRLGAAYGADAVRSIGSAIGLDSGTLDNILSNIPGVGNLIPGVGNLIPGVGNLIPGLGGGGASQGGPQSSGQLSNGDNAAAAADVGSQAGNNVGQSNTCDPGYWTAMKARAWMEAQREIEQNQNLIYKADSVLEYTCFDQHMAVLSVQATNLFSETQRWGNILPNTSMDDALTALVGNSLVVYQRENFEHPMLGGRGADSYIFANNPGGSYNCQIMGQVWRQAKCMNFLDQVNLDDFFYIRSYNQRNPRALPEARECPTGEDSRPWAERIAQADNTNATYPRATYNAYANFFATTGCDAPAIRTGVTVRRRGQNPPEYQEHVCVNVGCAYSPGNGQCSRTATNAAPSSGN